MAAMIRTSTCRVSTPPRRMNSFSWITRSSLAWVSSGMLPISSKKIEPPLAISNRPFLLAMAPVKAPLTWPKRLLSSRSAGIEPELTVTNGPCGAARVVVDGLGHQLLAGAALAQDQDVALGRRGELDQLVDLLHRLALADDVVEAEALAELLARARGSRCARRRCSRPLRRVSSTSSFLNGLGM